jgi:hypothetical protein
MHIMPKGTPTGGGGERIYTRETSRAHTPGLPLWRVRLEVCRLLWWPEWEGHAADAQAATAQAKADTRRRLGLGPELVLNILAVHEVRS